MTSTKRTVSRQSGKRAKKTVVKRRKTSTAVVEALKTKARRKATTKAEILARLSETRSSRLAKVSIRPARTIKDLDIGRIFAKGALESARE